ncbi:MAG: hypothetical protein IKQ06_06710 [Bacilli bacterium]|nr:hypothetical protein [Bacilli bacterium]
MNTRKLAYLFLSISLVMIVAGSFSSFLIGLREDHQRVLRRMDDVSGIFEGFSTNTTMFEDYRDELYTEVLGNVYYDTMYKTDETVKGKLNEYEAIVDGIKKDTKKLDSLCKHVYYPDSEVNKMCTNYKSIYEQVVNYYVTDIHTYNDNVEKYNAYQDTIKKDLKIRKYHTEYDYIDYNGDNIFDGKEE